MLFRPKFCANCGEKIERAEWFIWTSRRFCQVCESDLKAIDLMPSAVVIGSLLIGVFGFGSYLKSGPSNSELLVSKSSRTAVNNPAATQFSAENAKPDRTPKPIDKLPEHLEQQELASKSRLALSAPPAKPKIEVSEQVYFCRAETKKGTPCSRRVKGNVRCYQHIGMPAMAPVKN